MTSTPVYTSTAEGFRDAKEIAGLRTIPEAMPRAPRKQAEKRVVTNGIVCFCGERFAESEALEFMLHLRAEVGETLSWAKHVRQLERERQGRYRRERGDLLRARRQAPEVRERKREYDRERRARKRAEATP